MIIYLNEIINQTVVWFRSRPWSGWDNLFGHKLWLEGDIVHFSLTLLILCFLQLFLSLLLKFVQPRYQILRVSLSFGARAGYEACALVNLGWVSAPIVEALFRLMKFGRIFTISCITESRISVQLKIRNFAAAHDLRVQQRLLILHRRWVVDSHIPPMVFAAGFIFVMNGHWSLARSLLCHGLDTLRIDILYAASSFSESWLYRIHIWGCL